MNLCSWEPLEPTLKMQNRGRPLRKPACPVITLQNYYVAFSAQASYCFLPMTPLSQPVVPQAVGAMYALKGRLLCTPSEPGTYRVVDVGAIQLETT